MDAFILLALVVIYVTISYVPVCETPKKAWESNRTEQSSRDDPTAGRLSGITR